MQKEDDILVLEFQLGNKKVLASLVEKWHIIFCKKAYWLVKDADVAKDIAQESWQVIIEKIETLNDVSSFGSWASRIVYSKSLDHLRTRSKERLRVSKIDKQQIGIVETYKENTALKEVLLKAVKQLPDQQQVVVRLFYTESYSLKEISETLSISVGTAKSRLYNAREKLKLILKDYNYEN
ncbi:RNA polymerase sigma factor [Psychroserpens burtonensis]|uniref:RNA polymerase sigma factor n=1 Tax=Psychroserpens burtonensis TaxID=49278 RepID=A0A5C7BBX0_9FLAO|nr:RNA polymerase sigma factor [Psychroserpens burtonensis]TXE19611.1 RNA polymerase sigma factor [Psychroserpens burtonensis]